VKRSEIKRRPLSDTALASIEPETREYRELDGSGLYLRVKPDVRERFEGLRAREEKHRKTAGAAEQQAMLDGATWRKLFRESDGVLTKDIRSYKRQELDSRELALE